MREDELPEQLAAVNVEASAFGIEQIALLRGDAQFDVDRFGH